MLSETRDMEAAKRFFARARTVVGHAPEKVTTGGHDAYPRAIRETLGPQVRHRTSRYMNNRIEQDHRGIKQRYDPMRGFGSVESAARFCTAHDEVRDHFRHRQRMNETVSLAMIIFQANGHFGHLPYPLSPFRFERYLTPCASKKGIQILDYATMALSIGAVEGG